MKLVQFHLKQLDQIRVGLLVSHHIVVDLTSDGVKPSFVEFLQNPEALEFLQKYSALVGSTSKPVGYVSYDLDSVSILPPITKPDKILCIGMNYKEHCDELKQNYPSEPIVFSKFGSSIVGPGADIVKPACTKALDWEVELVVVIGKKARNIPIEKAYDYVLGYTIGQDLTARDLLGADKNAGQFILGKSLDTMCPIGPYIVTKDEVANPHDLNLKTWLNGELKQDGNTSEIIHRIDKLISYLSAFMTLLPGDLIMTGTPSGVGYFRKPRESLQSGDQLVSEIEGIGQLVNNVVTDK